MLNNVFNDMSLIFQEAYMKYMEENPEAGLNTLPVNDEEDAIDYDADGNPIIPERSKIIDPLPPVDHSMVCLIETLAGILENLLTLVSD